MSKEEKLTWASIMIGLLGVFAMFNAWYAGFQQDFEYQTRLFEYAKNFLLAAIWLKLGAIYHKNR
jgi:hypothetical protein